MLADRPPRRCIIMMRRRGNQADRTSPCVARRPHNLNAGWKRAVLIPVHLFASGAKTELERARASAASLPSRASPDARSASFRRRAPVGHRYISNLLLEIPLNRPSLVRS